MENYSLKTMEAYSKIVELTGEKHHLQVVGESKLYWTVSIKDCNFVDLMITVDEENAKTIIEIVELIKDEDCPFIEIVELIKDEDCPSKGIDYDSVYTLLGYASAHSIETKYNDHLKNDEDRSEVEI